MRMNLTEKEMGTIIKCIDSGIMSFFHHRSDTNLSGERKSEAISLNELKEKFCGAIIQEAENSKKKGGDKEENKPKIYISIKDAFKALAKAGVDDVLMHEITLHMDKHKLITLGFPIKSLEDLELFDSFLVRLRDIFADFVVELKKNMKLRYS